MIQDTLHQLSQIRHMHEVPLIHEVLHLLSGVVGSFFGTWAYFSIVQRRRIEKRA